MVVTDAEIEALVREIDERYNTGKYFLCEEYTYNIHDAGETAKEVKHRESMSLYPGESEVLSLYKGGHAEKGYCGEHRLVGGKFIGTYRFTPNANRRLTTL